VLVELGVAEQRYQAVLEVLDEGASVTDDRQADQRQPCCALSRVAMRSAAFRDRGGCLKATPEVAGPAESACLPTVQAVRLRSLGRFARTVTGSAGISATKENGGDKPGRRP
jgi:hypothetical protein